MSVPIIEIKDCPEDGFFFSMFGKNIIKNSADKKEYAAIYAERIFYAALTQMMEGYQGGNFKFMSIDTSNIDNLDIQSNAFFLLPDCDNVKVKFTNHFGTSTTISKNAACIVAWIITVNQVAQNLVGDCDMLADLIYCHVNDLTTLAYEFTLNNEPLFDQQDKDSFFQLTN
jgi:hypothetical protein